MQNIVDFLQPFPRFWWVKLLFLLICRADKFAARFLPCAPRPVVAGGALLFKGGAIFDNLTRLNTSYRAPCAPGFVKVSVELEG